MKTSLFAFALTQLLATSEASRHVVRDRNGAAVEDMHRDLKKKSKASKAPSASRAPGDSKSSKKSKKTKSPAPSLAPSSSPSLSQMPSSSPSLSQMPSAGPSQDPIVPVQGTQITQTCRTCASFDCSGEADPNPGKLEFGTAGRIRVNRQLAGSSGEPCSSFNFIAATSTAPDAICLSHTPGAANTIYPRMEFKLDDGGTPSPIAAFQSLAVDLTVTACPDDGAAACSDNVTIQVYLRDASAASTCEKFNCSLSFKGQNAGVPNGAPYTFSIDTATTGFLQANTVAGCSCPIANQSTTLANLVSQAAFADYVIGYGTDNSGAFDGKAFDFLPLQFSGGPKKSNVCIDTVTYSATDIGPGGNDRAVFDFGAALV